MRCHRPRFVAKERPPPPPSPTISLPSPGRAGTAARSLVGGHSRAPVQCVLLRTSCANSSRVPVDERSILHWSRKPVSSPLIPCCDGPPESILLLWFTMASLYSLCVLVFSVYKAFSVGGCQQQLVLLWGIDVKYQFKLLMLRLEAARKKHR